MAKDKKERDLADLYRTRLKDRENYRTKRRRQLESRPQRVAGLLAQYFRSDSQTLNKIEETRAVMAWENFVGVAAARYSQALRVRNSTLTVQVSDPIWMQQLSLLKQELLKKYMKDFPRLKIKDIFFTRKGLER